VLPENNFEKNVFINCPFDDDYEPILQALLFCAIFLGFAPRIATERNDAGENRLEKICNLIKDSKFSVHDLSRCQARGEGEYFRLNMPFELGLDYGCRQFFSNGREDKKFLILEEEKYRYQAVLSDLSGCDIQAHFGNFEVAVRKLRNWLVSEAGVEAKGATKILGAYVDFQEWYYESQMEAGFSEEDIQDYPTIELLGAMRRWMDAGKPV
jgi:hypothetical protein